MIPERIRALRESNGWSQTELAKRLGITRSSVNSYEQGVSQPSTKVIVEMSYLFHCSTDWLLGVEESATINVSGLGEDDVALAYDLITHLRKKNSNTPSVD